MKRYDCELDCIAGSEYFATMEESKDGDWVKHEEVDKGCDGCKKLGGIGKVCHVCSRSYGDYYTKDES